MIASFGKILNPNWLFCMNEFLWENQCSAAHVAVARVRHVNAPTGAKRLGGGQLEERRHKSRCKQSAIKRNLMRWRPELSFNRSFWTWKARCHPNEPPDQTSSAVHTLTPQQADRLSLFFYMKMKNTQRGRCTGGVRVRQREELTEEWRRWEGREGRRRRRKAGELKFKSLYGLLIETSQPDWRPAISRLQPGRHRKRKKGKKRESHILGWVHYADCGVKTPPFCETHFSFTAALSAQMIHNRFKKQQRGQNNQIRDHQCVLSRTETEGCT